MDTSVLDTSRAVARVERLADELRRLTLEVRRCAAVGWESAAADVFRERVAAEADRLELLGSQVRELVPALRRLEDTARERAVLVDDLADDIWKGMTL